MTYALALSLTLNRFGLRRCWRWILVSVVVVSTAGIVGFHLFSVELLPVPLLFAGGLALLLTQINRLWSLDRNWRAHSFTLRPEPTIPSTRTPG